MKEEFEIFTVQEKTKKCRQKKNYEELLIKVQENMNKIKTEYYDVTKFIEGEEKRKKLLKEAETEEAMQVKILEDKIKYFENIHIFNEPSQKIEDSEELKEKIKAIHN